MVRNKKIFLIIIIVIFMTGFPDFSRLFAQNQKAGIILTNDQGEILYSQNGETLYIPASILKILTSLSAIHILGETFQYSTRYFYDETSKNLYIKGFGDPLFISEVIDTFCKQIKLKIKGGQINNIVLDHSYFSEQITIPGKGVSLNPYDAPAGALCANFNTIMFKRDPAGQSFISAEPQTPLFDIFQADIRKANLNQGRIILSKKQSFLYPGQLIKYFLEKNHVGVTGTVFFGPFNQKGGKTHLFTSPFAMRAIIKKLLQYSNNYIANQVLLTIGAKSYNAPATLGKGISAIKLFAMQKLALNDLKIVEGSGLSRLNQVSPKQMLTIIIDFLPYHDLLNRGGNEFYKTGTLSDVRTRSGYFIGENNRLYPYVIMVNGKKPRYDSIITHLKKMVYQSSKK